MSGPGEEPFAEEIGGPSVSERRLFTSAERDFESGFDYLGARFYWPDLGRFTTSDPADPAGLLAENLSTYVMNDPLMFIDPTGMQGQTATDQKKRGESEAWFYAFIVETWKSDVPGGVSGGGSVGPTARGRDNARVSACIPEAALHPGVRMTLTVLGAVAKYTGRVQALGFGGAGAFSPTGGFGGGGATAQFLAVADHTGQVGFYGSASAGPTIGHGLGAVGGAQYMTSLHSGVTVQDVVNSVVSISGGYGNAWGLAGEWAPQTSVLTVTTGGGTGLFGTSGSLNLKSGFIALCRN